MPRSFLLQANIDPDKDFKRVAYSGAHDATIAAVNANFGTSLSEEAFDTIGGLLAHELGRVPRRGEVCDIGGLRFVVMLARSGAVRWFKVTRLHDGPTPG
jgi:magnesium and cobalt transporter